MAQDPNYRLPGDSPVFGKQTSQWTEEQLGALQLQIKDGEEAGLVGAVYLQSMILCPDATRLLLHYDGVQDPIQQYLENRESSSTGC